MLMTIIISIRVNPRRFFLRLAIYQSLYLVPSSASPCDLVNTSNTF